MVFPEGGQWPGAAGEAVGVGVERVETKGPTGGSPETQPRGKGARPPVGMAGVARKGLI